jgi:hypothetical protein
MNTIQMRFLLFLVGCIGVRLFFTFTAKMAPIGILPYLGYLALIPVIGWFYIIFIGKRDTGAEVFGAKIWWKSIRPIHMILYAVFSYMAITKNRDAWIVLLVDTLFGLGAFLRYHYITGGFKMLF